MVNLIGALAIEDKQDKQQYDVDFAFENLFKFRLNQSSHRESPSLK